MIDGDVNSPDHYSVSTAQGGPRGPSSRHLAAGPGRSERPLAFPQSPPPAPGKDRTPRRAPHREPAEKFLPRKPHPQQPTQDLSGPGLAAGSRAPFRPAGHRRGCEASPSPGSGARPGRRRRVRTCRWSWAVCRSLGPVARGPPFIQRAFYGRTAASPRRSGPRPDSERDDEVRLRTACRHRGRPQGPGARREPEQRPPRPAGAEAGAEAAGRGASLGPRGERTPPGAAGSRVCRGPPGAGLARPHVPGRVAVPSSPPPRPRARTRVRRRR